MTRKKLPPLTVSEAALALGISVTRVNQLRYSGELEEVVNPNSHLAHVTGESVMKRKRKQEAEVARKAAVGRLITDE